MRCGLIPPPHSEGDVKPSGDWNGSAKRITPRTRAAHQQVVYLFPYQLNTVGVLILGCASRLDAFSAYHKAT
jgi:hypothetical protein